MRHIKALLLAILVSALCAGQEKAYLPGEKIYFDIHYGIIQGGVVSLELRTDTFRGREVWHSTLLGRTTGMADAVFRVKDIYESFMEPTTGLPVFSIRNIREGRYTKYNEVIFDHYSRSDSSVLTSDLTGIHVTEKGIHDIHMNQGSQAPHNVNDRANNDGGIFFYNNETEKWTSLFIMFENQTLHTDEYGKAKKIRKEDK